MATYESEDNKQIDKERRYFASDVVWEVFAWIKGTDFRVFEAPSHKSFRFTKDHKEDIRDFLLQNGKELKKLVSESADEKGWKYDKENYLYCKRKILEDYKPEVYGEKDFVRLCAGIAFVAIGKQTLLQNENMIDDAINELNRYIKEALKTDGTLQDSTWAED